MNGPCRKCGVEILYRVKNTGSYDRRCKSCQTKDRRFSRYAKMGLSKAKREASLHGRCEVCLKKCKRVQDHCHATGKARGRLCVSCNLILGHAKDDPELLYQLASYLEDYEDLHCTDNDTAA